MSAVGDWERAWRLLGVAAIDPDVMTRLVREYDAPTRSYHNLRHIDECFQQLDSVRSNVQNPAEVILALWFHDAVYDSRRSDNELRSAEWADRAILDAGGDAAIAKTVRDLILATKHDVPPGPGDAGLLVDIDLAILGAGTTRFDEYEAQIREEYAWVADEPFRSGRAGVLRKFLARPAIYSTDHFRFRLEDLARANLARSLESLE